jgi:isoquinoline 1-oxidoreductase alpha subunit
MVTAAEPGSPSSMRRFVMDLEVNGQVRTFDAQPDMPLLWVLRDLLQMTGTKFGCGMALCGACTVHVDGQPVRSCMTQVSTVAGKKITTIEAIAADAIGKRVQEAWLELGVPQCGYCQSGQIMSATALIRQKPQPSDSDIDNAMSGNICRCGTYPRIRAAIKRAAGNDGGAR